MSATKNYIDNLMEQGVDILNQENNIDDDFFEELYLQSIDKMNKMFDEKEIKTE